MKYIPSILTLVSISTTITFAAGSKSGIWIDAQNDAVIRRTDLDNNATLPAGFVPIDLLSVSLEGWLPNAPTSDLYTGNIIQGDADFVRVQVVIDGLVSPPGPIGLSGFPYNPYLFGDRPITGFIEIDIDDQKNSGGELMPIAINRYLANVARFGLSPESSISERMAQNGTDLDTDFFSEPEFERSGAELSLILCGCFSPTIVSQNGNSDSIFDWGETWVVEGPFFERFESFESQSGLFGPSSFGMFDPITALQFDHDPILDTTTITLVFPITNAGAALQAGQPEQPIDSSLWNHTSIEEALDDLIFGANTIVGSGDTENALRVLTSDWQDEHYDDFREPSSWDVTALIGTAPTTPQPASFYVWTDTGFDEIHADLNLDELNNALDAQTLQDYVYDNDGGALDADNIVNGEVAIIDFGLKFHYYDLNYDGLVTETDLPNAPCTADFFKDGVLNFIDVSTFLSLFAAQDLQADLNDDESLNFLDVSAFLILYGIGCP